tara:strand:- start:6462 stop:7187 length:726 start_codon:yes stop_codon:yes gene_type:complete
MAKPDEFTVLKEIVKGLLKNGITPIFDGPSIILMDKKGNKVIDFSNGLGPVGLNLTMMSKLQSASKFVKQHVQVPICENQLLALASFCSHIGHNNFAKSGVLRELNNKNYNIIPQMLQRWRTGQVGTSQRPKVRQDFIHRRQFEAELFTTPDLVKIEFDPDDMDTKVTWKQLTAKLRRLTREALQELTARQAKGELLEFGDLSNLIKLATQLENPLDEIVIGGPVDPGFRPPEVPMPGVKY